MRQLGLLRPGNCAMAFFGVMVGAITELLPMGDRWWLPQLIDYPFTIPPVITVLIASVVAFLITGAGNALNDFYDQRLDRKGHPHRPIPSGKVRPEQAWNFAISLFIMGLALAVLVNIWCFMIAIVNTSLLLAYESRLKATGFAGNLTISYLTASVFLFGGAAVFGILVTPTLFLLAFLANVGREVTKDIEDMKADKGYRQTLPLTKGRSYAQGTAIGATVLAVLLSPLPYFLYFTYDWQDLQTLTLSLMGLLYLCIVILADAVFVYACCLVREDPKQAQKYMKGGMLTALIAFISPSLFIWMFMILYPGIL